AGARGLLAAALRGTGAARLAARAFRAARAGALAAILRAVLAAALAGRGGAAGFAVLGIVAVGRGVRLAVGWPAGHAPGRRGGDVRRIELQGARGHELGGVVVARAVVEAVQLQQLEGHPAVTRGVRAVGASAVLAVGLADGVVLMTGDGFEQAGPDDGVAV